MALQMSWQPSLLHQKRKNGPPLGLKNLGNTCYLNSVLQCLTYTPPLANFCLKNQHSSFCDSATERDRKSECPFCILEKRIVRSLSIDQTLDTPAKINSCLKIFAEHFRSGRQEDAHEFLRYVIDACHGTCAQLKKLPQQRRKISNGGGGCGEGFSGSSVVKEIFGGALQSQVKCLSCGAESNKVDEIMDISLDVLHSSSLKVAMQKFFQPEVLDGNNKYMCDNCKKLVAARKQMSILQAPNIFVIQLKRFEGITGGKIDKALAFEEVLVLSSYMCKASQDPHPQYNLFATIVHSGFSLESGHYYAYIKDAVGRWYCCNDSYVSVSSLQEVLSEKVYILFFSRTKQRPVPANTALATNGTKFYDCNGSDTPKIRKAVHPIKSLDTKQFVNHPSEKDNLTTSKVDKVPSSPRIKLSSFGKFPATINVKYVGHGEKNGDVKPSMRETSEKNGDVKPSICMEKSEINVPSSKDRNGVSKNISVDEVDSQKRSSSLLANGNGKIQSFSANSLMADPCEENGTKKRMAVDSDKGKPSLLENANGKIQCFSANSLVADCYEDSGTRNRMAAGRGPNYPEFQNGTVNCLAGSKRKFRKDSCLFFAEDTQSRAKLEEFKEALGKEAALVLRSCGWSDKVDNFMRSRKKLCEREAGNNATNRNEIKRSLIADAKRTFISQIPDSLRGNFIERLRSFSQEKKCSAS